MRDKKKLGIATGVVAVLTFGTVAAVGIGSAEATPPRTGAVQSTGTTSPPEGARAKVQVSPNPVKRGEKVEITGNCGGGSGLKKVIAGQPGRSMLDGLRIVNADAKGFKAVGTVKMGAGVGPVLVDCGHEAGVTLMVSRG